MISIVAATFLTYISCVGTLIGGPDDSDEGKVRGFSGWEIPKICEAKIDFDRRLIMINCKNGEKFMLPASKCSVSVIRIEDEEK